MMQTGLFRSTTQPMLRSRVLASLVTWPDLPAPGFFSKPSNDGRSRAEQERVAGKGRASAMLETITPDEVDLNGKALVVTYHPDPQQSELLRIDVAAHAIEAEASFIRMSELRLVVIRELMTRDAMHARVVAKAAKRGIERIAWIEQLWPYTDRSALDAGG